MLAAYLLGRDNVALEFAAYWMSRTERFHPGIESLFRFDPARQIQRHGGCFFFLN